MHRGRRLDVAQDFRPKDVEAPSRAGCHPEVDFKEKTRGNDARVAIADPDARLLKIKRHTARREEEAWPGD